ncbi:MAG: divalent-cation tolerance protein CutA, partial [Nitrospira sp.]|nr:divalent-cation tolerance protein CutA [Nitrospira sp.]
MAAAIKRKSFGQVLVVLVSTSSQKEAIKIARALVSANLAACANIIPEIQSIYEWKGKLVKTREVLILFKTTKSRYKKFEQSIRAIHSYETPEIIALPVSKGFDQYL